MSRGAVQSVVARLGSPILSVSTVQAAHCPRCKSALSFGTDGNGRVIETCGRCGEVARYRPRSSIAPAAPQLPYAVAGKCPHCLQKRPRVCIECGSEAPAPGMRLCRGCKVRRTEARVARKAEYKRRLRPARLCACGAALGRWRRVCESCDPRPARRHASRTCACGRPKTKVGPGSWPEKCDVCDSAAAKRRAYFREWTRKRKARA